MEYYNVVPNLKFMFHLDTLKLSKVVLTNISVPSKFKLKNIFEFLTGNSKNNSGFVLHLDTLKLSKVVLTSILVP